MSFIDDGYRGTAAAPSLYAGKGLCHGTFGGDCSTAGLGQWQKGYGDLPQSARQEKYCQPGHELV